MWNPFKKKNQEKTNTQTQRSVINNPQDMRTKPIEAPLEFREDKSIRPGDPAYDFLVELMESDSPGIAHRLPDGTWETKKIQKDEE